MVEAGPLELLFKNRHPHPLLIPHIIETVFEYLHIPTNIQELQTARLVCCKWNETGNKLFRKNSRVKSIVVENWWEGISGSERLKALSNVIENSFDSPIQKFRFNPGFFTPENAPILKQFLYNGSKWINTLELWFDKKSIPSFPKRCYPALKLENLENFIFGCSRFRYNYSRDIPYARMEHTYVFEALLNSCGEKLKKLYFGFPLKISDVLSQESQHTIARRFGDLLSCRCPKSVKNLTLTMKLTNDQLTCLTSIGLSLETLNWDIRGSVFERDPLHNFLSQQQFTLQVLRLIDSEKKFCYELTFPVFQKLKLLEIKGPILPPISYKHQLPVLNKFFLYDWKKNSANLMLERFSPSKTVDCIHLPMRFHEPSLVRTLARCFPNLREMTLKTTTSSKGMEVLAKVFEHVDRLVTLGVFFSLVEDGFSVDPVFTGIPLEDCEELLHSNVNLSSVDFRALQTKPSIANLSKLKRLIIVDTSHEIRLTDVTAVFGLLKMESLQLLEMKRFDISEPVFKSLKTKILLREYEGDNYASDSSDRESVSRSESDSDFSDSSSDTDESSSDSE